MSWNINQPPTGTWTKNATGATVNTTINKVGTSSLDGFRLQDNKKLFFGTDNDIQMFYRSNDNGFVIIHKNPSTNIETVIMKWTPDGGFLIHDPTITGTFTMGSIDLELYTGNADASGRPTDSPVTEGKIVMTEMSSGDQHIYIGLDDGIGG